MLNRIWKVNYVQTGMGQERDPPSKHSAPALVEILESRQLLAASLAPIAKHDRPRRDGIPTTPGSWYCNTSSNIPDIQGDIE